MKYFLTQWELGANKANPSSGDTAWLKECQGADKYKSFLITTHLSRKLKCSSRKKEENPHKAKK